MMITAAQVKELRERTGGAGMMECKKALEAANGDIEKAIEEMRKSGVAKAAKKAGRIAAEGAIFIAKEGQQAAMVEVNCETDFTAREENFLSFVKQAAQQALSLKTDNLEMLSSATLPNGQTLEQIRTGLVAKIGENIHIRRCVFINTPGKIGSYVHQSRIGVVVQVEGGDDSLAHEMALQITASNPESISPQEVSSEKIAKEKEIFIAQAADTGKPAAIIEKMVEGRIKKFVEEISLVTQSYIKDSDLLVGDLLKKQNAKVTHFIRYELGEGIEKEEVDFRAEVMAQVKGAMA